MSERLRARKVRFMDTPKLYSGGFIPNSGNESPRFRLPLLFSDTGAVTSCALVALGGFDSSGATRESTVEITSRADGPVATGSC